MIDGIVLEANHLRKTLAGQDLYVENLFDRGLKFKKRNRLAAPQIDYGNPAFKLFAPLG